MPQSNPRQWSGLTSTDNLGNPRDYNNAMNPIDLIQWPAMIATVVAAWLVASQRKRKREFGFWCFLFSNVLWVIWGLHDQAYALIALQVALAALNIRGAWKNDPASGTEKA
jgi:hypothetical protein